MFNLTDTGMPFYNQLFSNPKYMAESKGLRGQVINLTPRDYMAECASIHNVTTQREYDMVDKSSLTYLQTQVSNGVLLKLPMLDYARRTQEGRHRCVLAEAMGYLTVPVLIVTKA